MRKALGDNARRPRYIDTRHRRGYRFIAQPVDVNDRALNSAPPFIEPKPGILVGRTDELAELEAALSAARAGRRSVVMVTGEAGIGKTTLIRAFLSHGARADDPRIAFGQSAEHYGAAEPYHCIFEALMRACRAPWGDEVLRALDQHAPQWLAQMRSLVEPSRLRALQRRTANATRERMQRELTEALEAAASRSPLVLWLEDLHWADVSTIDWLAAFARRPESARILLIGTYRTAESSAAGWYAMHDELRRQGKVRDLALAPLARAAVAAYVDARFTPAAKAVASLARLASEIHRRTGGRPLFMVGVLNELVAKGILTCQDGAWSVGDTVQGDALNIPLDLWQVIDRQIDRLGPAVVRLLEVASAAGSEFSVAAVAAGAQRELDEVDTLCNELARRHQFLNRAGVEEWPDGTIASRFGFVHALYREAFYERLPAGRRAALHRRTGERLAQGHGDRASEIATQLAMHFERGSDAARAVFYLQQAGEMAVRRRASTEAAAHFERALDLLAILPDDRSRDEREVALRLRMSQPLIACHGFGSTVFEANAAKARDLCDRLADAHGRFAARRVVWNHSLMRQPVPATLALARELMTEAGHDPVKRALAHRALGCSLLHAGELREADRTLQEGLMLADSARDADFAPYGEHPGMICRTFAAWTRALMGNRDQAVDLAESGVEHARRREEPHGLAFALVTIGLAYTFLRDAVRADRVANEVLALSSEYQFPQWIAFAQEIHGWVACQRGDFASGVDLIGQAMDRLHATGARSHRTRMFANLAASCLALGDTDAAARHLDAAFVCRSTQGEHYYAPRLFCLRAALLKKRGADIAAIEASLAEALSIARRQGADIGGQHGFCQLTAPTAADAPRGTSRFDR